MLQKPTFSVILANYNGQDYLSEAIQSVLDQDFEGFEFLIVEDASTDDSRSIVESFAAKDERIRPLYQTENKGQSHAWNIGHQKSKADYLSFIDSDDRWHPGKLRKVKAMFENNPNAVLCQHNLNKIIDGKPTNQKFRKYLISGDILSFISLKEIPLFVPTTGLSVRSSVFNKIRPIPENFKVCADGYMTRTTLCFGEIESTMASFADYRVHDSNNTFENPEFDKFSYTEEQLIPALREFYEANEEILFSDRDLKPRKNWWEILLGRDCFVRLRDAKMGKKK